MIIAPSILSADFSKLGEQIKILEKNNITELHIDVMDGHFVPNISFGMPVIKSLRRCTNMFFDVHIMISEPLKYIDDLVNSGADRITFHHEVKDENKLVIKKIKASGIEAGISIKPNTDVEDIEEILKDIDLVLVMSVEPGFGGQKFMDSSVDKISRLVKLRSEKDYNYKIQVDGGINIDTISKAKDVDIVVAGSAVFKGNIEENINNLRK